MNLTPTDVTVTFLMTPEEAAAKVAEAITETAADGFIRPVIVAFVKIRDDVGVSVVFDPSQCLTSGCKAASKLENPRVSTNQR
ncbi:hypothetical protein [Acuticoccus sediminis]|uniref:hypothetical protein n=1 Tax=Acuticoccus sediminis TaxID=2184697 RepID=UPI001CFC9189|nr:hypothetical protein [Acuticoccus sediminis]